MNADVFGLNYKATAAIAAQYFLAVRLDYDRRSDTLMLSVVKPNGKIRHHELPLSITFSSAEIAAWLSGELLVIPQAFSEPPPNAESDLSEAAASG